MLTTGECDHITCRLMTLLRDDGRTLVEFNIVNRGFVQFSCIFSTGDGIVLCDNSDRAVLEYRAAKPTYAFDVTHKFEGFGPTPYYRLYTVISQAIYKGRSRGT